MMDHLGYWIVSRASDMHVHVRAVVKEDDGLVTGEVVSAEGGQAKPAVSVCCARKDFHCSPLTNERWRYRGSYFGFSSDSSLALAHMFMYSCSRPSHNSEMQLLHE